MSEHEHNPYYQVAEHFVHQYESLNPEKLHQQWLHLLPQKGGLLDVGAGSGRDAAFFAQRGLSVVAVEPAKPMRDLACELHKQHCIHWVDDSLPELKQVFALQIKFDLILLSAVWMHIAPGLRERAFRKLSQLLNPGGHLVITLRHGEFTDGRIGYAVSADEIRTLSMHTGLQLVLRTAPEESQADLLDRSHVKWETIVLARMMTHE
ncbi:class I SAM-dependent methyltransferase [Rheinheimera sp.]|uniref:class I SAM-dependent methyltransferase n=1 Tax=Rheinheimera sp. TaxID=1869214 RepID=UPI00307CE771